MFVCNTERIFIFAIQTLTVIKLTHSYQLQLSQLLGNSLTIGCAFNQYNARFYYARAAAFGLHLTGPVRGWIGPSQLAIIRTIYPIIAIIVNGPLEMENHAFYLYLVNFMLKSNNNTYIYVKKLKLIKMKWKISQRRQSTHNKHILYHCREAVGL